MYLRGRVTMDLTGTEIELQPPRNCFGGVANLMTKGRWKTAEELETHKLLAFAQSANRALMDLGVSDVVRVSIGTDVIYEDLQNRTDDFPAAMEALRVKLDAGFEPDPHSEFDLVLKHDDGVLNYVIDLDFVRRHRPGVDPVAITVTAVPSQMKKRDGESDAEYQDRLRSQFRGQLRWDDSQDLWEKQLNSFVERVADHVRTSVGVVMVQIKT